MRASRPCATPGCPGLVTGGARLCARCQATGSAHAYDEARGSAAARGYDATWRKLRLMMLAQHPLCADPWGVHGGAPPLATDVDHVVAKRHGGTDDPANLQCLCHACHSRKTAGEGKANAR